MEFITMSVGLNACRIRSSGVLQQPKMTKVAAYLTEGSRVKLQAISGHDLSNKPGFHTMSEEDYQTCPQTA